MDRIALRLFSHAPARHTVVRAVALVVATTVPAIAFAQAGPCGDPWVNQAFQQIYRRAPIGSGKNIGECDITRYGNGHWSSYQDLVTKIAQAGTGGHTMPPTNTGNPLIASGAGTGTAGNASSLVNGNAAGIVAQGGGNIVAQGGGNIVSQGGGNLIGQDGNGFRTLSVDKPHAAPGKYLVAPGGNLVDSNGNVVRRAGSYLLVARNGGYAIGTGAGARAPSAGVVVTP